MPFPITCAACHKTFSIADDVFERKVKGRVVTIKCKQCQAGIRVDGTNDKPVFSVADSVRPPPVAAAGAPPAAAPALAPIVAEPPAAVTAPAPLVAKTPAASPTAGQATARAAAPNVANAPLAARETFEAAPMVKASPAVATQKAATAAAVTSKATAVATAKPAPVAASPKAATATPLAKPIAVATAPKVEPAGTTKTAPRAPLGSTGAGATPIAVTPKAPAVAPTAKAPAPLAKTEPAPTAKVEPAVAFAAVESPAAPTVKAAPVEPTPVVENLWAVDYPDGEDRELTLSEIEKELAAGTINLSTLVWRDGMAEWLELGQLPELSALHAVALAAPIAAPEPPPQRPKAPSAPAVETGLSLTLPQPTAPLPPQRPPAPSPPVIDFAKHDALGAAPPAPIPKLPPTFSTGRDSRPPTPPAFTPGAPPFVANPAPAFPSAPAAAPALAAPFPAPMPARANPSNVTPVANVEDWPQKSRAPWIIGGIALLAVCGLIFFLTRSSGDELPPPAPISALPASVPSTPAHTIDPEPTTASDDAAATQPSPGSNAAMQPPGSAPIATPNAGFAELFASGARSADEKNGVSGPGRRFDPAAAKAALAAIANKTADCREKGGPTGSATVVVTFDPTGKVASATVSDPPFAGTSSGACIAAAMKLATVRAFSGLPGTVTKVISIQ